MIFNDPKPIYLQIADKIMDDIVAGSYGADSRLPSVREYAASVEVNANTVMRTYDFLQQRGMIYNKRGIGYFVATDAGVRVLDERRRVFFAGEADYFFGRLHSFDVSPERLSEMYSEYLKTKSL
ncbi:MAG: GntR family transcriptional regulator [Paramuribaculum sp.]|nr:GntR family transcriptional regulator [Paramuribaculum sp.]